MGMGAKGYEVADGRKRTLLQRTAGNLGGSETGSAGDSATHFGRAPLSNRIDRAYGSPPPDRPLLGSSADEAEACVTETGGVRNVNTKNHQTD